MLTYNKDIFKKILKPIDIKYYLDTEDNISNKYACPRSQNKVWNFLYPYEITKILCVYNTDVLSCIDNKNFNRVSSSAMQDFKFSIKGVNSLLKSMDSHLKNMVLVNAAIKSYLKNTSHKPNSLTKNNINTYMENNADEVNKEFLHLTNLLANSLNNIKSEILLDKRFNKEITYIFDTQINLKPIMILNILCIFALFDENENQNDFLLDLTNQYKILFGIPNNNYILPHDLTNTPVIGASTKSVLFRDLEYNEIISALNDDMTTGILLSGMGGCGKTSIARLVYCSLKKQFDCCGWISYSGSLKKSLTSSILLDSNSDEILADNNLEQKWKNILQVFSNSKQKKLLIIDNVDFIDGLQNPNLDEELASISSWDNIKIIVTSRLPHIPGYEVCFNIENLGNKNNCDNCIELFYHYNKDAAKHRKDNYHTVQKLCELAQYNTMVIELLAKSSLYEYDSLIEFYNKLNNIGFYYVNEVPVTTMHDKTFTNHTENKHITNDSYALECQTALYQITKLFNLKARTEIERQVIWDFHCLPEAERISKEELKSWLGYSLNHIHSLKEEGWIKYEAGFFYIHPLIRQSITSNNDEWIKFWELGEKRRLSLKTQTLVNLLQSHELFNKNDSFDLSVRKLYYADYLSYEGRFLTVNTLLYIADFARKLGVRDISCKYYKLSYDLLSNYVSKYNFFSKNHNLIGLSSEEIETLKAFWKSTYYYGYMLSYTKSGFDEAEIYISLACKIIQSISHLLPNEEMLKYNGMSFDHYGYMKSNNNKGLLDNAINACMLYRKAISYRETLCSQHPNNLSYFKDLAWSIDNLGTLFAITDHNSLIASKGRDIDLCLNDDEILYTYKDEYSFYLSAMNNAESYIAKALEMRINAAKRQGKNYSSEIAWTYCNLGTLLSKYPERYNDAENAINNALKTYDELEKNTPNKYKSSIARTLTTYAKLLSTQDNRVEEAINIYNKALKNNEELEHDFPGVYIEELTFVKEEIDKLCGKKSMGL